MDKTRIDWADSSWNPISGCLHRCEYCYARRMANRFAGETQLFSESGVPAEDGIDYTSRDTERGAIYTADKPLFRGTKQGERIKAAYPFCFHPTLHRYRMDIPSRWERPRNIFVGSMSDVYGDWVPDEWITEVWDACIAAPQHNYMFLTKNPQRYIHLSETIGLPQRSNFWFGTSTPTPDTEYFFCEGTNNFISIEPIFERFDKSDSENGLRHVNWVIVGAETGNRKNKVVPQREWIEELAEACDKYDVPLFMKSSLLELMGDDFVQEYPLGLKRGEE